MLASNCHWLWSTGLGYHLLQFCLLYKSATQTVPLCSNSHAVLIASFC